MSCDFGVLCLLLAVSWAGLLCVVMEFPGRTHLLFYAAVENHTSRSREFKAVRLDPPRPSPRF